MSLRVCCAAWAEAAPLFDGSARRLEALTDCVVDVILGKSASLEAAAAQLSAIADLEEQAFRLLQEG